MMRILRSVLMKLKNVKVKENNSSISKKIEINRKIISILNTHDLKRKDCRCTLLKKKKYHEHEFTTVIRQFFILFF